MASTLKVDTIVHPTGTPNNLTLDNAGNVTVGNNLTVTGTTTQTGNVSFTGSAAIGGNATIGGATFSPSAPASGSLALTGTVAMGSSFKRNRIINGNMLIDQRNAGTSITPTNGQFCVDRWRAAITQSSKFTTQQNAGSVTPPVGFSNYLGITSSSAYSISSGDVFAILQPIEGFNFADFNWGTANAKTITLSAWVYSSLTGTFGGSLQNSDTNRAYPFSYSIPVANTWTKISIVIPGDTTGTWVGATTDVGVYVSFSFGVGSTYSGTANAWAAANLYAPTGAVSVVGTNGATFYITGVQLEEGSVATPYERQIYSDQLAQCQRYYTSINGGLKGVSSSTQLERVGGVLPVPMRSTPTLSLPNGSTGWFDGTVAGTLTAFVTNYSSNTSIEFTSAAATGAITGNRPIVIYVGSGNVAASAEL